MWFFFVILGAKMCNCRECFFFYLEDRLQILRDGGKMMSRKDNLRRKTQTFAGNIV